MNRKVSQVAAVVVDLTAEHTVVMIGGKMMLQLTIVQQTHRLLPKFKFSEAQLLLRFILPINNKSYTIIKNHILIITTSGDQSTNTVMDWIREKGFNPIRINTDNLKIENEFLICLNFGRAQNYTSFNFNGSSIDYDAIKSVWFRKFGIPNFKKKFETIDNIGNLIKHINGEYFSSMYAFFDSWKENKKSLGGNLSNQPTKMQMLINAKKYEIDIPDTIITNNKNDLKKFLCKHTEVITKPVRGGNLFYKFQEEDVVGAMVFTELLNTTVLNKMSNHFFYTLFQEKLNKDFEIRTFYLDGKCYSMAIFSQLDRQTDVDFRMYNDEKNNRTNPYQLPIELERKIDLLMKSLNLNTGSLDIIKTKDNKFVFLEINPWGQYGMVSDPCNYYLDEKIAGYLTDA